MNGPLDLLWSTSQILLNNTPVNSSTDFHYIKSSIVKLVTLSGDERRSQHACGYVYEGTIDRLRNNIFGIFGPPPPSICIFLVLILSKNWHFPRYKFITRNISIAPKTC